MSKNPDSNDSDAPIDGPLPRPGAAEVELNEVELNAVQLNDAQLDELLTRGMVPQIDSERMRRLEQVLNAALEASQAAESSELANGLDHAAKGMLAGNETFAEPRQRRDSLNVVAWRAVQVAAASLVAGAAILAIVFWFGSQLDSGGASNVSERLADAEGSGREVSPPAVESWRPKSPSQNNQLVSDKLVSGDGSIEEAEAVATRPDVYEPAIISRVVFQPRVPTKPRRLRRLIEFSLAESSQQLRSLLFSATETEAGTALLARWFDTAAKLKPQAVANRNRVQLEQIRMVERTQVDWERYWWARVHNRQLAPAVRRAAFAKLCRYGSVATWDQVRSGWGEPALRADVIVAAERWGSLAEIQSLAADAMSAEEQQQLLTILLQRKDDASVAGFVRFVAAFEPPAAGRVSRLHVAQQCGEAVDAEVARKLLSFLQSNRLSYVRAAAATLSDASEPVINERLLALAQQPQTSRAAILALTIRRDDAAQEVVDAAAQDQRWSATIVDARRKWARMLN